MTVQAIICYARDLSSRGILQSECTGVWEELNKTDKRILVFMLSEIVIMRVDCMSQACSSMQFNKCKTTKAGFVKLAYNCCCQQINFRLLNSLFLQRICIIQGQGQMELSMQFQFVFKSNKILCMWLMTTATQIRATSAFKLTLNNMACLETLLWASVVLTAILFMVNITGHRLAADGFAVFTHKNICFAKDKRSWFGS